MQRDDPAGNSPAWEVPEAGRTGPRGHELPGGKPAEATAGLCLTVAASHLVCPKPKWPARNSPAQEVVEAEVIGPGPSSRGGGLAEAQSRLPKRETPRCDRPTVALLCAA